MTAILNSSTKIYLDVGEMFKKLLFVSSYRWERTNIFQDFINILCYNIQATLNVFGPTAYALMP